MSRSADRSQDHAREYAADSSAVTIIVIAASAEMAGACRSCDCERNRCRGGDDQVSNRFHSFLDWVMPAFLRAVIDFDLTIGVAALIEAKEFRAPAWFDWLTTDT
jgi:hypothetical protein